MSMASVVLPRVLDLSAASLLRAELLAHRTEDIVLDASQVERLSGLCLQVLVAARMSWTNDGKVFQISGASGPCLEAMCLTNAATILGVEE